MISSDECLNREAGPGPRVHAINVDDEFAKGFGQIH